MHKVMNVQCQKGMAGCELGKCIDNSHLGARAMNFKPSVELPKKADRDK